MRRKNISRSVFSAQRICDVTRESELYILESFKILGSPYFLNSYHILTVGQNLDAVLRKEPHTEGIQNARPRIRGSTAAESENYMFCPMLRSVANQFSASQ